MNLIHEDLERVHAEQLALAEERRLVKRIRRSRRKRFAFWRADTV